MGVDQSGLAAGDTPAPASPQIKKQRSRQKPWVPCCDKPSGILNEDSVQAIHGCLPKQLNRSNWELVYSLEQDGASLHTLLDLCAKHDNCVLVIQDSKGGVFGGFTACPWAHNAHYFGAVSSMVFELVPSAALPRAAAMSAPAAPSTQAAAAEPAAPAGPGAALGGSTHPAQRSQSHKKQRTTQHHHGGFTCTAYRWAGGNRYFQSVSSSDSHSSLAMGGGGAFAWSLDEELLHGSSGACDTFASPPLSASAQFRCARLEVWALHPALADDALLAATNTGLGGASASVHSG